MTKFGQGISTGPEVAVLMGINLEPGGMIEYSRIEAILGMRRTQNRFRTILQAWTRRVFREQRLQYAAERGIGIRFLTDSGALEHNIDATKRTAKAGRRIATKLRSINTVKLSEREQKQHHLTAMHLRAWDDNNRRVAKELAELATPKPITSTIIKLHG